MIVIYNPKDGSPINDIFQKNVYKLDVNEVKKFDPQTGRYLLDKFHFLKETAPEEVSSLKEEMKVKNFKCEYCEAGFETQKSLHAHKLGKHKMSKENEEILENIPSAEPAGKVIVAEKKGEVNKIETPEEAEGIPADGQKDGHGIEFYGEGLQEDVPTDMSNIHTKKSGVMKG